jgi:hypothetical protein
MILFRTNQGGFALGDRETLSDRYPAAGWLNLDDVVRVLSRKVRGEW